LLGYRSTTAVVNWATSGVPGVHILGGFANARGEPEVDVRTIGDVRRILFDDTVPVWQLLSTDELAGALKQGKLEQVIEFELVDGRTTDAHRHPTHEFYYILSGRGTMLVEDEEREVHQGDLVWVRPNELHQLRPGSKIAPLRCFTWVFREPETPSSGDEA
jgi:quercetin dioxygenase-like cupin family protein